MNIPTPLAPYDTQYTAPLREQLFQITDYLSAEEREFLEKACAYAFIAHDGTTRKSGEPYITHPISVTIELAKWGMDLETLCAGLMHDVLEDTDITKAEMATVFGNTIATMVDGLSKLEKLQFNNKDELFAESFRKLILAMTKDVRVIVVKLSDRLHNMKTLSGVPKLAKRISTSRETLEVYAPIALRLGMNKVYREMQQIAFENIYPWRYAVIQRAVDEFCYENQQVIDNALKKLQAALDAQNLNARLELTPIRYYSIYKKMKKRKVKLQDVHDIFHLRVILPSELDCYVALGVVHRVYAPQMGRIKDLIAVPNANNYQSLHTVLKVPYGKKNIELALQIRSEQMNTIADYGITAISPNSEYSLRTNRWLQTVSDLNESSTDAFEFLENMKTDLFPADVYVFTPKGEIINLPRGATVIDFAYNVHTKIGNHCMGGKVNGKSMSLRTPLRSGDTVEIITSPYAQPNQTWLNFVVTARARAAIRQYIKTINEEDAKKQGGKLLAHTMQSLLDPSVASSNQVMQLYLADLKQRGMNIEEVQYKIGTGQILPITVVHKIAELAKKHFGEQAKLGAVLVKQHDSIRINLAKCCRPINGDAVSGVIVSGEGLVVHRDNCPKLLKTNPEQQIEVDWGSVSGSLNGYYEASVRVLAQDGHGLLAALSSAIAEVDGNIAAVETISKAENEHGFIEFLFALDVKDLAHLKLIIQHLQRVANIREVVRV